MYKTCSVIIPFFNEGKRISDTVREVLKCRNLSQIICVDDGSTDNVYKKIEKDFNQVKLIRSILNKGKSQALKSGVKEVRSPYALILDADLGGLNYLEIDNAVSEIIKNKLDMLILGRINAPLFVRLTRGHITYSGDRIIKTQYLKEMIQQEHSGYQLESAINSYAIDNKLKVAWIPFSGTSTFKIVKWGLSGLSYDYAMYRDMFSYKGFSFALRQQFSFCLKQV